MLSLLRKLPFMAKHQAAADQVAGLYQGLVDLARMPGFYQAPYAVPDTLEGRFDLLSLLVGTLCLRLSQLPGGAVISQDLFDLMFRHIERNFREAGVGDLSVPKQMRRIIQAFYGRNKIYAAALLEAGQQPDWPAILSLNVYNQPAQPAAVHLATWLTATWWPFLLKRNDIHSIIDLIDGMKVLREGL